MANKNPVLGRDDRGSIMQITSYITQEAYLLDGTLGVASSPAYSTMKHVRIISVSGGIWITREIIGEGASIAGDGIGMYLPEGGEISMTVFQNDNISIYGGVANVTPMGV